MFRKYQDHHSALERAGKILASNVGQDWIEIQADVELLSDGIVSTTHFYRPTNDPSNQEPLHIASGFEHLEFSDCFKQVAQLTGTPEKGSFKRCTYRLQNTGKYSADYEY
jgi:hypothetical protein